MKNPERFIGKIAIVTGAASGIGLATAERLGSEGASVALVDIDEEKLAIAESSVRKAGAPGTLRVVCDVADTDQVAEAVKKVKRTFGNLDVVVNNAGLMVFKPLEEHQPADWSRILGVDLMGSFFFTQQAFLHMTRGGAIVNVSSIHAVETTPLVTSYAAAKAAVLSLTRSAALEGKLKGIRVNAILPGAVSTPMLWDNPNIKSGLEIISRKDVGQPSDIAAAIAYLASDDASFVQGAGLRIDGGRLALLK